MPTTPTPLRYTLDCQAVPWHVLHVEEIKSLARPPGVVLDVTTDRPLAELGEVERTTASLLIETQSSSRVVRGWVRCVEAIGVVDARAHLRLHLVPLVMAEDAPVRRVEVEVPAVAPVMLAASLPAPAEEEWAVEPAMMTTSRVVEAPPLEEQDVTAEHTPAELRAMRREDDDESERPRAARVLPQRSPQVPVRTGGTQLMSREDLERLAAGARPERPTASSDRSRREDVTEDLAHPKPATETERIEPGSRAPTAGRAKGSPTETERLKPIIAAAQDEQPVRRAAQDDPPERKRRKKRNTDDETSQMTWEQIEAFHRDRGKPKP